MREEISEEGVLALRLRKQLRWRGEPKARTMVVLANRNVTSALPC